MDTDVLGNNVLVEMLIDGDYFPLLCAKDVSYTLDQDEIETTHINSGASREYVPGMSNATITVTAVTHIYSGNGRVPLVYMMDTARRQLIQTFRITLRDNISPTPTTVTMTMDGFYKTGSFTGPRGGLSNSNLSIRVTGDVTFGSSVPAPTEPVCEIEDTLYLDTTPGQSTVQSDDLKKNVATDVVLLLVSRTGDVYTPTTGTPTNMQYSFNSVTGIITFDAARVFEAGEVITVLYKRIDTF